MAEVNPMFPWGNKSLAETDPDVLDLIEREKNRQWRGLELIASEVCDPSHFAFCDLPNVGRISDVPVCDRDRQRQPEWHIQTVAAQLSSTAEDDTNAVLCHDILVLDAHVYLVNGSQSPVVASHQAMLLNSVTNPDAVGWSSNSAVFLSSCRTSPRRA